MRLRTVACALLVLVPLGFVRATEDEEKDQPLLDHFSVREYLPTDSSELSSSQVFRMELDVTGDGKPELFLASSSGGSKQGLWWMVYTPDRERHYRCLGSMTFGYNDFYYSERTSILSALAGGVPSGAVGFTFYHVGADGIREMVDEKIPISIDDRLVNPDTWPKNGYPPVYKAQLEDLRKSAAPQWRTVDTEKIVPSLGKLEGSVPESDTCEE